MPTSLHFIAYKVNNCILQSSVLTFHLWSFVSCWLFLDLEQHSSDILHQRINMADRTIFHLIFYFQFDGIQYSPTFLRLQGFIFFLIYHIKSFMYNTVITIFIPIFWWIIFYFVLLKHSCCVYEFRNVLKQTFSAVSYIFSVTIRHCVKLYISFTDRFRRDIH